MNTKATTITVSAGSEDTAVAATIESSSAAAVAATLKPRRLVRRKYRNRTQGSSASSISIDPILLEKVIAESNLPRAYSFEISKTVQRIVSLNAKHVALQMPEGLLLYATVLSDVLKRLVAATTKSLDSATIADVSIANRGLQVSIMGDVTYGACCVDDLGAQSLGCDLLVHYGHSCLVPIQHTVISCLYVFVEITIDVPHLVDCLHLTLKANNAEAARPHVYLLGTIQFRHALSQAEELLQSDEYRYDVSIPQAKPLSPGEVLGCTSPVLTHTPTKPDSTSVNAVVLFVADGRFHLESTLISNPHIPHFFRYDPYSKTLTEEFYQHDKMKSIRYQAIQQARSGKVFGIILGTLGRQGNPALLSRIQALIRKKNLRSFVILASEITPAKLALFGDKVDGWVQIACPRLSVDWGHALSANNKPVLNPYEFFVCLDETPWRDDEPYPMDYYAQAGGPWSNYYGDNTQRKLTLSS